MYDGNRANVSFYHSPYGFKHSLAEFRLIRFLSLNQVADTQLTPPGKPRSELSKSNYRGRSICRKADQGNRQKAGEPENSTRMGKMTYSPPGASSRFSLREESAFSLEREIGVAAPAIFTDEEEIRTIPQRRGDAAPRAGSENNVVLI